VRGGAEVEMFKMGRIALKHDKVIDKVYTYTERYGRFYNSQDGFKVFSMMR
jgi:hypothetical protein